MADSMIAYHGKRVNGRNEEKRDAERGHKGGRKFFRENEKKACNF